jgi:hypothetical protein
MVQRMTISSNLTPKIRENRLNRGNPRGVA